MAQFETSEVRSLEDMVAWNETHADVALPLGMFSPIHDYRTLVPTRWFQARR
jgi:hypothetical protein